MFVGLNMLWSSFNISNNCYNNTEFVYTLIERIDSVNQKDNLFKSFFELRNEKIGKYIKLNEGIKFKIEIDENGFYYSNDEYNIYAYGMTQEEAENDIFDEFIIQYEAYALEKDENLDDNSKILKNKLLRVYGGNDA